MKTLFTTIIFIIFLLIFGISICIFLLRKNTIQPIQTIQMQLPDETPTPEIVDTAPSVPASQKTKILVHHSDSTFSLYLVPVGAVEAYEKTLPVGDSVVKQTNP